MYLLSLSTRDGSSFPQVSTTSLTFEKTCRSVSWRVWCPIDIVLWAIISALVLALLLWTIYTKATKLWDSDDQKQGPKNATLREDVSIKNNVDDNHCPCGIADPHFIVHSREGSLVIKDAPSLATLSPALLADTQKKSSSRRLTGLGISFGSTSMMDLHFPQMQGISRQGSNP